MIPIGEISTRSNRCTQTRDTFVSFTRMVVYLSIRMDTVRSHQAWLLGCDLYNSLHSKT